MKPRIALCMEYAFAQAGGQEAVFRLLTEAFSDEFDLVLVTGDTAESWTALKDKPAIKRHIPWAPGSAGGASSRALAKALAAEQVELAHFHFGGTFSWGNRRFGRCPIHHVFRNGISCVSTVHSVHPPLGGYIGEHRPHWVKLALFPLAWGAKCYTLSRTAIEVAVSRHDLEVLRGCCGPLAHKQRLIYHSVLRETDAPTEKAHRQSVILSVGNIGYRKGQAVLVEAFNGIAGRFPDWNLVLVGRWEKDDPYVDRVQAMVRESPHCKRIEICGGLPYSEVRQLMRTSAIFCLPSLEEGLGLALQEALLSGSPAVASRTGGIPELIDEGVNGLLVPPGDAPALGSALADLMGSSERWQSFADRARSSVLKKGMSVEQMIQNYKRAYDEVLASRTPRPQDRREK